MDTDTPITPAVAATNGSPAAAAAPAELDLDAWIDGTCGITHTARIYQRGDLLATIDQLKQELEVAKKTPKEQRGVGDRTPEKIEEEWASTAEQLVASALIAHVQDRTEERRRKIREDLAKKLRVDLDNLSAADDETISLHLVADAIVKVETLDGKTKTFPDGFPADKLRELKDRLGDSGIFHLIDAFRRVTREAPTVAAPLSLGSSSGRGGGM
jgi:hypothetical protein